MKTHGIVDVKLHRFLTTILGKSEWLASRPGRFTAGRRPLVHIRWNPEPVWMLWRKEKSLIAAGESNADSSAIRLVARYYTIT
jgi:hypothetical protein